MDQQCALSGCCSWARVFSNTLLLLHMWATAKHIILKFHLSVCLPVRPVQTGSPGIWSVSVDITLTPRVYRTTHRAGWQCGGRRSLWHWLCCFQPTPWWWPKSWGQATSAETPGGKIASVSLGGWRWLRYWLQLERDWLYCSCNNTKEFLLWLTDG